MKTYTEFGRLLGFCTVAMGLDILHFEIFHARFISVMVMAIVAALIFVGISMMMEDGK